MATIKDLAEQYGVAKAQDQNENLGRLAELLGSARDIGNEYKVPSWVPLAGGTGAGDLLMGRTPEEIENWSYGNAPMQIPEMSNVPQFKRGRAQSLADALTTLAPGVKATEGLPAGLSFIGPKSRNWDKVAAELAAKKLDEGADPAEVWREHLIGRMPDKTLFSEISDDEMSHVIPLNKWVNRENGQFMAPNISTAWDEAASTLTPNAPVRIKRLFNHEQLKNEYPYGFTKNYENQSIMDMPVFMHEKNSQSFGSLGDGDLTLHPSLLPKQAKSTVLHELQHAIQNEEGWGQGGNLDSAASFYIENYLSPKLKELNNSINEGTKLRGNITNEDEYAANVLRHKQLVAEREKLNDEVSNIENNQAPKLRLYNRLAGEAQARATQDRLDMDMAQRRENYPLAGGKLSDIPLEELIYKYEGNGPSLDVHGYGTAKKIADVLNTKYGKDIDADISGNDRGLTLNKLIVDADKRNQGIGSNFLKDLTQYADEESLPMQLTAAGDFGGNKARQVSLYKKYGFLENKGKNKDYSISENMYRAPNDLSELSKYKDYVGEHSAPLGDSGAPLHNLTANENAIYPSDVYSSQANQYYGSGEPEDAQLFAMAQRLKDKPNEKVSIYRAVPKVQSNSEKAAQIEKDLANYMKRGRMPSNSDFNNKSDWYEWASNERDRLASLPEETLDPLSINHGDWVALDKKYAKEHGESALGGNYKILSKKVPARQLFTNGDSIREWGWDSRYAEGGSVDAQDDEGYADKASSYLDDLAQLKEAYPNANKFMSALKDAAYRSVPTTEQMMDPEFILENAGFGGLSTKLLKPIKASEAYGRIEGQNLNALETDRTKVGKGFLGGVGYTGLQHTSPPHAEVDSTWGVQTPSKAATIINGTVKPDQPDPVFTTFIGSPDQHKSNNLVFDLVHKNWRKASKDSDLLTPELIERMNERLATHKDYVDRKTGKPLFPADINVLSKNLKDYATTFDRRAALAEVLGGKGVGGKKGQIFDYDKVIRDTTDPALLDVPSGSLGNRLFTLNGGILTDRYDLNPAFPTILQGKDFGLIYEPVPRELVFKDFVNEIRQKTGRDPGYMHWTRGYPPSQLITEDLLTEMQKAGYAKGGEVKALHDKYEESDYGYGNRPDKTKKGLGYFGELERPDGTGVMTEYSIGVPINGEEMDVPTLVPTLTPDEIRLILHMQDGDDMPRSIVHKAIDHAHQRLSEGKPIFATEEDLYAHGGIVDVLHNDAIEQIMKAFMDSMADDEEPSAPAVSIEITTQNTETPRRGKIPKSIAREAKHG